MSTRINTWQQQLGRRNRCEDIQDKKLDGRVEPGNE